MTHEVKYGFSQPCKAFAFKITDSIFTKSIILNRVILYDSLIWIACSMIHMIWLIFNSPKLGRVIFLCIHWYQCRTHLFELNTLLDIRNDIRHPDFCTALHLVVEIVLGCCTGLMSHIFTFVIAGVCFIGTLVNVCTYIIWIFYFVKFLVYES